MKPILMRKSAMADTFTNLDTRELSRRLYMLLDDFSFQDTVFGKIVAKKSFQTNYASIDILYKTGLLFFYSILAGYGDKAATIHDWVYSGFGVEKEDGSIYYPTRKECDQIFFRALRDEGVDIVRSYMFYMGVRLGGSAAFTAGPMKFIPTEI